MAELSDKSIYKKSLLATSLFGGVQVFKIIIQVVRSKCVAVLLGPSGVGIMSLFSTTVDMISSFTNCGLSSSAVRNISESTTSTVEEVPIVTTVLRKLIWWTGIVGALVCFIGAPLWSKIAFGNNDFSIAFRVLSANVVFMQLSAGQRAILQGLQKYKFLAKSSLLGDTIGLIVCVPLYYFFKINAIVPVLLIANIIGFLLSYYYCRKLEIPYTRVTRQDIKKQGGNMVKMGVLISLSTILGTVASYIIRVFIRKTGSMDDVGLYGAGFTLLESYVGLVFTAMATDYYPRLSRITNDHSLFCRSINSQAEIAVILLAPLTITFVVFLRVAIMILYSKSFIPVVSMLYWSVLAILFRAIAWSLSYSILAKGNSRLFFRTEFIAIIYGFIFNILGYSFWGLEGLGISYLLKYIVYFAQLYFVTNKYYYFRLSQPLVKMLIIFILLTLSAVLVKIFFDNITTYIVGSIIALSSFYYSYVELNKRVYIKDIIINLIKKK